MDCLANTLARRLQRLPAQLRSDLRRFDRVAPIVSEPVCDVADQVVRFAKRLKDQFNHGNILHLCIRADVIDFARPPFEKHRHDSAAMILHMDPVPDVQPVSINGQFLVRKRASDHQRNELLRELIRPVVVRAPRNDDLLPERLVRREREQVRGRLARRIRRTRVEWRHFREASGRSQRAIDLVGRDLQEPLHAMPARRLEKHLGAADVRVDKVSGLGNTAIHMRLRREVHNRVKLVLCQDGLHRIAVGNVGLEELVTFAVTFGNAGQVVRISRVGEHIDIRDEFLLVMLQHKTHKIAADEPAATSDEKTHPEYVTSLKYPPQWGNPTTGAACSQAECR